RVDRLAREGEGRVGGRDDEVLRHLDALVGEESRVDGDARQLPGAGDDDFDAIVAGARLEGLLLEFLAALLDLALHAARLAHELAHSTSEFHPLTSSLLSNRTSILCRRASGKTSRASRTTGWLRASRRRCSAVASRRFASRLATVRWLSLGSASKCTVISGRAPSRASTASPMASRVAGASTRRP